MRVDTLPPVPNDPAGMTEQEDAPEPEKLPAPQSEHPVEPVVALKVPAPHFVHVRAPRVVEISPAGQTSHTKLVVEVAFAMIFVPGRHGV